MCVRADFRQGRMDVLEKREEQVSVSGVRREGGRLKVERYKSCVALEIKSLSNSKQSYRPG